MWRYRHITGSQSQAEKVQLFRDSRARTSEPHAEKGGAERERSHSKGPVESKPRAGAELQICSFTLAAAAQR
jgi:hypothetical protein